MGSNHVHWSPDLDVTWSTSVKEGTDEKFQDWKISGGSSQSQPWGREKGMQPCAVNMPADTPQALSASIPILLQWLVLYHLALNHWGSCWGSMKVEKKGLQKNVLWKDVPVCYNPTPGQWQMPPQHGQTAAAHGSHADTSQQAAQSGSRVVWHTKAQQICYFLHLKGKKDN